jgi:hypothetical protein
MPAFFRYITFPADLSVLISSMGRQMKNRAFCVAVLFLLLSGCASVNPQPAKLETSFFLARYEKVWETTRNMLEKQSIPVLSMDMGKGIITTKPVIYSAGEKAHNTLEEIAYKPDIFLALYTNVRYGYTIRMIPSGEMSTQIKVTANIEAYDKNITRKWHSCVSKNILERDLLEKIRAEL